jgi:hypothetical protein
VKLGDVVATILFWLVFGPAGLVVGGIFIAGGFSGIKESPLQAGLVVVVGVTFIAAVAFGIWQSFESLKRGKEKNAA